MKLGLVIASHGRPDILHEVVAHLTLQRRIPDEIAISAVGPEDIPAAFDTIGNLRKVFGSAGVCSQRNRGMSCLIETMDIIVFIDDDFIVGENYFVNVEKI